MLREQEAKAMEAKRIVGAKYRVTDADMWPVGAEITLFKDRGTAAPIFQGPPTQGASQWHVSMSDVELIEAPSELSGNSVQLPSKRKSISEACDTIKALLLEKNEAYGDSALVPLGIFSQGNASDSLCARIDDKLARIKNKGLGDATEDTLSDVIGYLILLQISRQ